MTTAAATLTSGNMPITPPTANPPAAPPPTSGLPSATPSGWWDSVKDPEVKTWLSSKSYPDAETALKSSWSLERLMGADRAGRTVTLPKDDADAAGWAELNKRIGVPESAEGYKLPLPDGADDGFSKTAAGWFHEAGVPPRAANKVAEKWNGWIAEQVKAAETADKAESEQQMGALEKEWGGEFSAKRELAQRGYRAFAEQFGLTDAAALERAESVLGAANLTKFFAGLGSLNAESSFIGGDKPGSFQSANDAQKQIDEIRTKRMAGAINDHQWRTQYQGEVERLGKIVAASLAAKAA